MAHADYDCCACCDRKMAYGGERTKEELCAGCAVTLSQASGRRIINGADIVTWVAETALPSTVGELLQRAGFQPCYYENDVDRVVMPLLTVIAIPATTDSEEASQDG